MINYYRIKEVLNQINASSWLSSIAFWAEDSNLISRFKGFVGLLKEPDFSRDSNITSYDTYNLIYMLCQFNQDKEYERLMALFEKHLDNNEYVFLVNKVDEFFSPFYRGQFDFDKFQNSINENISLNEVRVKV